MDKFAEFVKTEILAGVVGQHILALSDEQLSLVKKAIAANIVQIDHNCVMYVSAGQALTAEEIEIGKTQGKLACIKAYKLRTGDALLDAKHWVESQFAALSIPFATRSLT